MAIGPNSRVAVWVVTPNGLDLARRLRTMWPHADLFCSRRLAGTCRGMPSEIFAVLPDAVEAHFHRFEGHIFIMAAGIVVRSVAPHLESKTTDPAVVVVDDRGRFAISLVSGHLGGANQLARQAADLIGAAAVITTATDVNAKPAIDLLAADRGLKIGNPAAIKAVNMALLREEPIQVHDPYEWLHRPLPNAVPFHQTPAGQATGSGATEPAGVWVDDRVYHPRPHILVLRPPSLVAGIGCNRNTPKEEIHDLLRRVLAESALDPASLCRLASIDLKSDEPGLCRKEELGRVEDVPTPSATVSKHVGVPSVCEAAAILSSRNGRLIIPKKSTRNVTVAIARLASISSASDPAI
ncbi:MAG: cobalt-precorrin 5A hydrolase [Desulfobacteraceae bacterium]